MIKAIVEIPQNSRFKFEIKPTSVFDGFNQKIQYTTSKLVLDRMINQEIPFTYGYIPGTLCDDHDPLDIFIITDGFIPPFTEVYIKIVGAFRCIDNGQQDDKLIGRIVGDDNEPSLLTEVKLGKIKQYLRTYKENFQIIQEVNQPEALDILEESRVK